jgi:2,4-dienoyl-CoA reductase-like NADH-dependent reductase (Old Yellow Enzyme family)
MLTFPFGKGQAEISNGLKNLVHVVYEEGSKIAVQLVHAGRQTFFNIFLGDIPEKELSMSVSSEKREFVYQALVAIREDMIH